MYILKSAKTTNPGVTTGYAILFLYLVGLIISFVLSVMATTSEQQNTALIAFASLVGFAMIAFVFLLMFAAYKVAMHTVADNR